MENSMSDAKYDKVQSKLDKAIEKDAPCNLKELVPVLVTLDNGVKYKGDAYKVLPKSDIYSDGLVMVRTDKGDMGVPVTYIQAR
jgi:hypothetical protein